MLLGVLAAPLVTDHRAGGFHGATRALTIRLVRILFPGAGLLVCSAWCLGILNSHRKFFLSYTAPVLWNLAMIATLLGFRQMSQERLIVALAWGSVVGSALQFAVQLPVVLRLARHIRVRLETHDAQVREVVRNFVPVFISRGVVQISAYVDVFSGELSPRGRGRRADERADPLYAACESVRHGGLGGGTAGHVQRAGRRQPGGRLICGGV